MSVETGKQSFKDVVDNLWRVTQDVLKQVAVRELSKTEAVRREVEAQKTLTGKNILWQYFPFILGGLVLVMILRFKG